MADLFEHPKYQAAELKDRWPSADLPGLWHALKVEAWGKKGRAAVRILPSGMEVGCWVVVHGHLAMRRCVGFRRESNLDGSPVTAEGWAAEVRTMLEAFGITTWKGESKEPGKARWVELYAGEINIGTGPCPQCGAETAMANGHATKCERCVKRERAGTLPAGFLGASA